MNKTYFLTITPINFVLTFVIFILLCYICIVLHKRGAFLSPEQKELQRLQTEKEIAQKLQEKEERLEKEELAREAREFEKNLL